MSPIKTNQNKKTSSKSFIQLIKKDLRYIAEFKCYIAEFKFLIDHWLEFHKLCL